MATTVYTVEFVKLQDEDETTVALKPLRISALRKFMKAMDALSEMKGDDEFEYMERLLALTKVCLDKQIPQDKLDDSEWLEDALDLPTMYKVIEVCGGIKLNDPNLLAAAEAAMTQTPPGGTN